LYSLINVNFISQAVLSSILQFEVTVPKKTLVLQHHAGSKKACQQLFLVQKHPKSGLI